MAVDLASPAAIDRIDQKSWTKASIRHRLRQHIIQTESPFIARLQSLLTHPLLDVLLVKFMTALGTHTAFLIILPILFWLGDAGHARHLTVMLGEGVALSSFVKDFFCLPRPAAPPVKRRLHQKNSYHLMEYGLPSTHSTNSATITLYLLFRILPSWYDLMQPWTWYALNALVISYGLILPLSRVYCGMHSFLDISGGTALGSLIYFVHSRFLMRPIDQWFLSTLPISVSFHDASFGYLSSNLITSATTTYILPRSLTLFLVLVGVIMYALIKRHPDPTGKCPCYDDAVCHSSVIIGVLMGSHTFFTYLTKRVMLADSVALPASKVDILTLDWTYASSWTPLPASVSNRSTILSVYGIMGRILLGTLVLLIWRTIAKTTFKAVLTPIYQTFDWPLYSNMGQQENPKIQSPSGKSDKNKKEEFFKIERWSLEMVIKWIVYGGIGWIATDTVPRMFLYFGY